ncbi:polysaccharide pyruvyl transferase family protein [Roseomonas sp. F4]
MNMRFHRMLVEEVLLPLRNKSVLFLPNSGNAGDSLINMASMHCLERMNIRYKAVGSGADVVDQTVLLGGGGNFIPAYGTIRKALLNFHDKAKEIILLPHTIRGNEDVLEMLGPNITLIARDVESYQHALQVATRARVLLGHDMAFHLDAERLLRHSDAPTVYQPAFEEALERHKVNLAALQAKPRVYFARRDVERAGPIGGADADISAIFAFGTWPGKAEMSSWSFLEAIRTAPPIESDRLHVGIGAALLGKDCVLHDNNYGKNKGVWQHSLRHHFPHVAFAAAG